MATKKEIKFYKLNAFPSSPIKDAVLYILDSNTNEAVAYITDLNGVPIPLKDLTGGAGVQSVTNTDGSITITGTSANPIVSISAAMQSLINSALQSGDNISELINDAGYITLPDIPNFNPSDYDLTEFTNTDSDPFARISDLNSGVTNLNYTPSPTQGTVTSDTGTDAIIPLANGTNAGLITAIEKTSISTALQPTDNISELTNNVGYITSFTETDPIFQASEASLFVSGDKTNLDNQSGVNTGDETTSSIQTKRPLKTVDGQSLEGVGNIATGGIGVETDPIFTASEAFNITNTDITNLSNLSGVNTGDQDLSLVALPLYIRLTQPYRGWQGVVSDENYIYTFTDRNSSFGLENIIQRYDHLGNFVDEKLNAYTGLDSLGNFMSFGSGYVDDDYVWVTVSNSNSPSPNKESKVVRFNKNDLTFVEDFDIGEDSSSGLTFYNGNYYISYHDPMIVRKFNTSFVFQEEYNLSRPLETYGGYQSIFFKDGFAFFNYHGANSYGSDYAFGVDKYSFDGSDFTFVENITPPTYGSGQQVSYGNGLYYWADRVENKIIITPSIEQTHKNLISPSLMGLHIVVEGEDNPRRILEIDNYANNIATANVFAFRKARGTKYAPSAILDNQLLGGLSFRGHDGVNFEDTSGGIYVHADEDFTPTSHGNYISFRTTAPSTTNNTEKARIHGNGDLELFGGGFKKSGGTSSQFLKADGSADSTTYLPSSSYTALDVLTKLLTVDGSGSGLDADLLRGVHWGNVNTDIININASGVKHRSQNTVGGYLEIGVTSNVTSRGFINFTNGLDIGGNVVTTGNLTANSFIKSGGTSSQFLKADGSVDSNTYSTSAHTHTFASLTSKPTTISGYGITDFNSLGDARWLLQSTYTAADVLSKLLTVDGSGSGIDSDLLDGVQGSNYMRVDVATTNTNSTNSTSKDTGAVILTNGGLGVEQAIFSGGNMNAPNFVLTSDKRKKKNIKKLEGDSFNINWKQFELKDFPNEVRYGVIAQEVQKEYPELISTNGKGELSVKYIDLLCKKMAEKDKQIEGLEIRLSKLEELIKLL